MSIAINNTNPQVFSSFESKVKEKTQTNPSNGSSKISNTTKAMIGGGLLALAAAGIYIATRGRTKLPTTPNGNNPVAQQLEQAIEEFKNAGNKFVKGKAILADGTNYTGNIVKNNKDGSKVVMEYLDGVIQKSTKTNNAGETIFEKTYKYTDNGIGVSGSKNGKFFQFKKVIDKKGNVHIYKYNGITSSEKQILIDKKNNIIMHHESPYAAKYYDLKSGKKGAGVVFSDFRETSTSPGMCENPRIKGINLLEHCGESLGGKNDSGLHVFARDTYLHRTNGENVGFFDSYRFEPNGQYKRRVQINSDKYRYNGNNGNVYMDGQENPIFKYNYRTKKISDLKIDEKQAKELVEQTEKEYAFIKRATNTHFDKLRTDNEVYEAFNKL